MTHPSSFDVLLFGMNYEMEILIDMVKMNSLVGLDVGVLCHCIAINKFFFVHILGILETWLDNSC